MRKISEKEMRSVNGGAYNYRSDCTGWNFDYRNYHSIPIKGYDARDQRVAAEEHNKELRKHKSNEYFKNFYHSAQEIHV